MNNFYLVNKPSWISSFDIIRQMRKKLNIKKMGHTGTLDPLATWLMLIATGNYTKLIPYLEKDTKSYVANIMLDWTTPSFDCETEVSFLTDEKKDFFKNNLKREEIENILIKKFTGEILQTPPVYSALNIWWKKAYQLAREWVKVEMKQRKANILKIEILEYNYPLLVLDIKVSAWTYIRSIANELWEELWTWGYLNALERTSIWKLDIKDSVLLDKLVLESSFDVKKIFSLDKFIDSDKFNTKELGKIDNGMFFSCNIPDKEEWELFVYNDGFITNILLYEGGKIIPKKKI